MPHGFAMPMVHQSSGDWACGWIVSAVFWALIKEELFFPWPFSKWKKKCSCTLDLCAPATFQSPRSYRVHALSSVAKSSLTQFDMKRFACTEWKWAQRKKKAPSKWQQLVGTHGQPRRLQCMAYFPNGFGFHYCMGFMAAVSRTDSSGMLHHSNAYFILSAVNAMVLWGACEKPRPPTPFPEVWHWSGPSALLTSGITVLNTAPYFPQSRGRRYAYQNQPETDDKKRNCLWSCCRQQTLPYKALIKLHITHPLGVDSFNRQEGVNNYLWFATCTFLRQCLSPQRTLQAIDVFGNLWTILLSLGAQYKTVPIKKPLKHVVQSMRDQILFHSFCWLIKCFSLFRIPFSRLFCTFDLEQWRPYISGLLK